MAAECAEAQADWLVTVEVTTANAACGSRVGPADGARCVRGGVGSAGGPNSGRDVGAAAAGFTTGGGLSKGSVGGSTKAAGRSSGAYSGPSRHVAMRPS